MSGDEDFSLVEPSHLSQIQASISTYEKTLDQLIQEQKELRDCRDDRRQLAQEFRQRRDKLLLMMKDDQETHEKEIKDQLAKLDNLKQEEKQLMKQIQEVEEALKEEGNRTDRLQQQTNVLGAVPERKLVFKGTMGKANDTQAVEMKPQVIYPMQGGTALVTFEEEDVAKKILALRRHQVALGKDCSITVEARPVNLMLPRLVEIDIDLCPRRILISDLPAVDAETLLDKLEIHFSKAKNGGGEVDECEMLPDSGTIVITFVKDNVAQSLTDTEFHDVLLNNRKHRVRATPFLNGTVGTLKTQTTTCRRSVLLTGIPAVMEPESLQDLLEIHFQKSANGGGEIQAFLYNPPGGSCSAFFSSGAPTDQ